MPSTMSSHPAGDRAVPLVRPTPPRPAAVPPLPPVLDEQGLLRHRGRWVPIPDTQLVVVDLLVRNLGNLVRTADVRSAYEQAGGSVNAAAMRSLVHRLNRRLGDVGLRVHAVRGRGLVLDVTPT